jgi:tetratricopeptide (TPR) repeat protein
LFQPFSLYIFLQSFFRTVRALPDNLNGKGGPSTMTRRRLFSPLLLLLALTSAASLFQAARCEDNTEKDLKVYRQEVANHELALRALDRGKEFLADKSYDQARKEFDRALTLDVNLHEARFSLGLVNKETGGYKVALAHFYKVYSKNPGYESVCQQMAECFMALGDCGQAGIWLDRQLKRDPRTKQAAELKRRLKDCYAGQEKRLGQRK